MITDYDERCLYKDNRSISVDELAQLKEEFLFGQETYQIIGAAMSVHRELGPGFLEAVYQEALALEFFEKKIPYKKEQALEIQYKGGPLSKRYFADFLCQVRDQK